MSEGQKDIASILKKRAEKLAATAATDVKVGGFDVAIVAVGDERFGLPVSGMKELVALPPVTGLPGLPTFMPGITQVRGVVVSVVDLGLYLSTRSAGAPRFLALVEGPRGAIGLAVERVLGFERVTADAERTMAALGQGARTIQFVTSDLIAVLDLVAFCASENLVIAASSRRQSWGF